VSEEKEKEIHKGKINLLLEECYEQLRVNVISEIMALNYSGAVLLKSGSDHWLS
jgi:hypothetical protein